MMERDRERIVVDAPEILKQALRLAAGVDEQQRGLVALEQAVNFVKRMTRAMTGPGQMLFGVEHRDVRLRAACGDDEIGLCLAIHRLRHKETAQVLRLSDSGRQTNGGELRSQPKQPRHAEREQLAALRGHQ